MLRKVGPSDQLEGGDDYASIRFTQGPRQKSKATIYYEMLIKDILQSYHNQCDLHVSYNSLNEIVITANGRFYNLARLLKHKPDFEQLSFGRNELAIYDNFLRDPKTAYGHIENRMSEDKIKRAERAFPDLTRAEMSAIRHYTVNFYAPMNFLLKFNAAKPFPRLDEHLNSTAYVYDTDNGDLKGALSTIAGILNPNNSTYDPYDPVFLAASVREILLGTAITASALSKPIQAELHVAIAASYGDFQKCDLWLYDEEISPISDDFLKESRESKTPILIKQQNTFVVYGDKNGDGKWGFTKVEDKDGTLKNLFDQMMPALHQEPPFSEALIDIIKNGHIHFQNNFMQLSGATLVLVPNADQFEITMMAYGRMLNQQPVVLDIRELLSLHQTMQPDGIVLSPVEFEEITSQLGTFDKFSLLEDLSPLVKTKFIDILTAVKDVSDLFYEPIIRFDEDVEYFTTNYLPAIYDTINTSYCFHFYSAFYSASLGTDPSMHQGLNIQTILVNPIMWGKNIQLISLFPREDERLLIPGQQFGFTSATLPFNENNYTVIYLRGFPIRSIDGIDSYSHDEMLPRKQAIGLPCSAKSFAVESKKADVVQLQTSSAAPRAEPFFSSIASWVLSSKLGASNFIHQALVVQPAEKLGSLFGYYFDELCQMVSECETYFPSTNRNLWSNAGNPNVLFNSKLTNNASGVTPLPSPVSNMQLSFNRN